MSRLLSATLLEVYALVLALIQHVRGVRSDEAASLLNIPVFDPPLIRTILHRTEFLSFGDVFWRIVFATILIQAVWFIYETAHGLPRRLKKILCGAWLLSASLILSAGMITMSSLAALFGLMLVLLLTMEQDPAVAGLLARFKRYIKAEKTPARVIRLLHDILHKQDERLAFLIACLWLAAMFTTYQALLYFPIVVLLLLRTKTPHWKKILYFYSPLLLLLCYTLRNPLLLLSFLQNVTQDAHALSITAHLLYGLSLWSMGGGLVLSIVGTAGIVLMRRWELLASLLLLFLFAVFSPHIHNSILFLPLFIGGTYFLFHHRKAKKLKDAHVFAAGLIMAVTAVFFFQPIHQNSARAALHNIPMDDANATILLVGPYSYEWSYYSKLPIVHYAASLKNPLTEYMVCLEPCPEGLKSGMKKISEEGVEVYERQ